MWMMAVSPCSYPLEDPPVLSPFLYNPTTEHVPNHPPASPLPASTPHGTCNPESTRPIPLRSVLRRTSEPGPFRSP
jgi:hypothetical protein